KKKDKRKRPAIKVRKFQQDFLDQHKKRFVRKLTYPHIIDKLLQKLDSCNCRVRDGANHFPVFTDAALEKAQGIIDAHNSEEDMKEWVINTPDPKLKARFAESQARSAPGTTDYEFLQLLIVLWKYEEDGGKDPIADGYVGLEESGEGAVQDEYAGLEDGGEDAVQDGYAGLEDGGEDAVQDGYGMLEAHGVRTGYARLEDGGEDAVQDIDRCVRFEGSVEDAVRDLFVRLDMVFEETSTPSTTSHPSSASSLRDPSPIQLPKMDAFCNTNIMKSGTPSSSGTTVIPIFGVLGNQPVSDVTDPFGHATVGPAQQAHAPWQNNTPLPSPPALMTSNQSHLANDTTYSTMAGELQALASDTLMMSQASLLNLTSTTATTSTSAHGNHFPFAAMPFPDINANASITLTTSFDGHEISGVQFESENDILEALGGLIGGETASNTPLNLDGILSNIHATSDTANVPDGIVNVDSSDTQAFPPQTPDALIQQQQQMFLTGSVNPLHIDYTSTPLSFSMPTATSSQVIDGLTSGEFTSNADTAGGCSPCLASDLVQMSTQLPEFSGRSSIHTGTQQHRQNGPRLQANPHWTGLRNNPIYGYGGVRFGPFEGVMNTIHVPLPAPAPAGTFDISGAQQQQQIPHSQFQWHHPIPKCAIASNAVSMRATCKFGGSVQILYRRWPLGRSVALASASQDGGEMAAEGSGPDSTGSSLQPWSYEPDASGRFAVSEGIGAGGDNVSSGIGVKPSFDISGWGIFDTLKKVVSALFSMLDWRKYDSSSPMPRPMTTKSVLSENEAHRPEPAPNPSLVKPISVARDDGWEISTREALEVDEKDGGERIRRAQEMSGLSEAGLSEKDISMLDAVAK
ncbi:hypothetical protein HK102_008359, partial [Quaeritorhiza haematococci]